MSEIIAIPDWLRTKTGESETPRMMRWIAETQRKLKRSFPEAEQAFCRIVDKLCFRLTAGLKTRLWYTRQHPFKVAPGIVFFGDFYFRNVRLLAEIDGPSHRGLIAAEKDAWRSRLISAWDIRVVRFTNEEVLGEWRPVEKRIVCEFCESIPNRGVVRKLQQEYGGIVRSRS